MKKLTKKQKVRFVELADLEGYAGIDPMEFKDTELEELIRDYQELNTRLEDAFESLAEEVDYNG